MSSDIVSFGETMLRLTAPRDHRLETSPLLHVYVGGSESNVLASLARLNLHVYWISALPANPLGKHIETELKSHGIDTSAVVWSAHNARVGTYYAEEASRPLGVQVYYDRAHSACALIDPDAVDYSLLESTRLLHLSGITPPLGKGAREVFQRLLARAQERGLPLSFDVNYRGKLWSKPEAAAELEAACRQAQILFCSRADATELWGFKGSPEEILHQMEAHFKGENTQKTIVLTLGAEGSVHLHKGEYAHAPAFPIEGSLRFGSGDAFCAGYLYAYLQGPLYQEIHQTHPTSPLTFGNALAALKRCIVGDIAVITPDDLRHLLQKQEGRRFR